MKPVLFAAVLLLTCSGCLGGGPGGGVGVGTEEEGAPAEGDPQCATSAGVLRGQVFYWGAPGDPDSSPADSVDVFLTNGGPTFRTPTGVDGSFAVEIPGGDWTVAADDPNGCQNENAEVVTVEPCDTTDVTLVIDLCDYGQ